MPDSKIKLLFDMIHYIFLIFNIAYIPLRLSFSDSDIQLAVLSKF